MFHLTKAVLKVNQTAVQNFMEVKISLRLKLYCIDFQSKSDKIFYKLSLCEINIVHIVISVDEMHSQKATFNNIYGVSSLLNIYEHWTAAVWNHFSVAKAFMLINLFRPIIFTKTLQSFWAFGKWVNLEIILWENTKKT